MSYKGIISKDIHPLTLMNTVSDAIKQMEYLHIQHLPLVEDKKLKGLFAYKELIKHKSKTTVLGTFEFNTKIAAVAVDEHIFNIIQFAANHKLSCIPVINAKEEYVGSINTTSLLYFIAEYFSFTTAGSILILEMHPNDYSLIEIAGIIENNHAKITNLFTRYLATSSKIEVNIKINKEEIEPIIQTFNRYNYHIKAVFSQYHVAEELKGRYEALINYLNI